jgi:hypothetical protein
MEKLQHLRLSPSGLLQDWSLLRRKPHAERMDRSQEGKFPMNKDIAKDIDETAAKAIEDAEKKDFYQTQLDPEISQRRWRILYFKLLLFT